MACLFTTVSLLAGTTLVAEDWPQFLGPNRDGVYAGPALADSWPEDGPARVWTKRIGQGLAGPVVTDGRLILFHRIRNFEVIEALDALTGLGASVNAATPLIIDDLIFLSATYGTGALTLRVSGNELTPLWASDDVMSNHYATSIYHDGYLYGYHGRQEFNPSFRAVELRTGSVRWSEDRFRAGTVTLAGDHLLILRETGELILADPSPDRFRPIARAQILDPTVRAYPALANGYLYARNEDTLVCLDLRP